MLLASLALLSFLLPGPPGTDGEWTRLLARHVARHPSAMPVDIYKFTHQSVFGPAHAVPDRAEAARYLREELASLAAGPPAEPPNDVLDERTRLARVNLRPFVANGGDVERLVDAFVATAARVRGDPALMRSRLGAAVAVLGDAGRGEDADALAAMAETMAARGFPAVHHSETYRREYRPAYRVVLLELIEGGSGASGSR